MNVCFDAGGSQGRESTVHTSKIDVVYSDNPHRESIVVTGEINFPNLSQRSYNLHDSVYLSIVFEGLTDWEFNVIHMHKYYW